MPDGSGVWYRNENLKPYAPCVNNDDLVLYLYKEIKYCRRDNTKHRVSAWYWRGGMDMRLEGKEKENGF